MTSSYEGYVQYADDTRISLQCSEGRCSACPSDHDDDNPGTPLDGYDCEHTCTDHDELESVFVVTRGQLSAFLGRPAEDDELRRFVQHVHRSNVGSTMRKIAKAMNG